VAATPADRASDLRLAARADFPRPTLAFFYKDTLVAGKIRHQGFFRRLNRIKSGENRLNGLRH
jgi:hypothetical protein